MARKNTDKVDKIFTVDLVLTEDEVTSLLDQVDEPTMTDGQKIGGYALSCLKELAAGGCLIEAMEAKHMRESTGLNFTLGEELIPFISRNTKQREGMHIVEVAIDPTYWDAIQEIADVRGWPVDQLVQEAVDNSQRQGWFEAVPEERIKYLAMNPEEKAEIEELLGGSFATARDLFQLIRNAMSADDIFPSLTSNIGLETQEVTG